MTEAPTGRPRPVVFFSGKGGVGKTTLAAAYAGLLAERGQRTLLVSTDPAHSTADLLGRPLGPEPVALGPSQDAMEIDAELAARAHVDRIARDAERVVSPEVLPAVRRHLAAAAASPGTMESALLDRLADVLAWCGPRYDRIVVDTAPTGHALRLLTLPTLLTGWVEGLVRARERAAGTERMLRNLAGRDEPPADPVLDRLRARRDAVAAAGRRLREDSVIHLVLVPERLPLAETVRAAAGLAAAGLTVGAVLANRVLPEQAADGFLAGTVAGQRRVLADLSAQLPGHRLLTVAHLPHEPGPADLPRLAARLAAGGL